MIQQDIHQINAIQNHCIRDFGTKVVKLGTLIKASTALEGIICGLIYITAQNYKVDPLIYAKFVADNIENRMKEVVEKPQ